MSFRSRLGTCYTPQEAIPVLSTGLLAHFVEIYLWSHFLFVVIYLQILYEVDNKPTTNSNYAWFLFVNMATLKALLNGKYASWMVLIVQNIHEAGNSTSIL